MVAKWHFNEKTVGKYVLLGKNKCKIMTNFIKECMHVFM